MRDVISVLFGSVVVGNRETQEPRDCAPVSARAQTAPARRGTLVQQWLSSWWELATYDERTWAVVQMRRAFPELAEFLDRQRDGVAHED